MNKFEYAYGDLTNFVRKEGESSHPKTPNCRRPVQTDGNVEVFVPYKFPKLVKKHSGNSAYRRRHKRNSTKIKLKESI